MNQEQQPRGFFDDTRAALGWMTFIANVLATSVEPMLHGRFGSNYFGYQALGVFLLIPLYALFWKGYDIRPLMYFLGTYVAMCAVARIGVFLRYLRHDHEHSHYSGYPRIMWIFPRLGELTVKRCIEPTLVFLIGLFTVPYNEPLGWYLVFAAIALFLSMQLSLSYTRQRAQDMYDAMIEQRNVAERFREMRGDRF